MKSINILLIGMILIPICQAGSLRTGPQIQNKAKSNLGQSPEEELIAAEEFIEDERGENGGNIHGEAEDDEGAEAEEEKEVEAAEVNEGEEEGDQEQTSHTEEDNEISGSGQGTADKNSFVEKVTVESSMATAAPPALQVKGCSMTSMIEAVDIGFCGPEVSSDVAGAGADCSPLNSRVRILTCYPNGTMCCTAQCDTECLDLEVVEEVTTTKKALTTTKKPKPTTVKPITSKPVTKATTKKTNTNQKPKKNDSKKASKKKQEGSGEEEAVSPTNSKQNRKKPKQPASGEEVDAFYHGKKSSSKAGKSGKNKKKKTEDSSSASEANDDYGDEAVDEQMGEDNGAEVAELPPTKPEPKPVPYTGNSHHQVSKVTSNGVGTAEKRQHASWSSFLVPRYR